MDLFTQFWEILKKGFESLPDPLKLFFLLIVFVITVVLGVAWWLKRRALKDLTKDLRRKEDELKLVRQDRDQLQARIDSLNKVDEHVWKRPDLQVRSRFVDPSRRSTRFIALFNLKGGVGKTTLTANLGAGLALRGKKVLLVDLDFQATLSSFLLAQDMLQEYQAKEWTSEHLVRGGCERVQDFFFPAKGMPNAWGMIARENLEILEYAQQARFFVDEKNEVRFHAQTLLHTEAVFQAFDYVLFDCPPRMTTACINALTCADYVLIPTTLSQVDIEAVPRTLRWLKELHQIVRADFLGAVITRCKMRTGELVRFDQGQLEALEQIIRKHHKGGAMVFNAKIADSPDIHRATANRRPLVLDDPALFQHVIDEVERRVRS